MRPSSPCSHITPRCAARSCRASRCPSRRTSGVSPLIKDHLAGGASRLAALLLPQILPVFSVVAPCHPGAALRDLVLVQRRHATSPARRLRPGASEDRRDLRTHG